MVAIATSSLSITADAYARAYQDGFARTVRFLASCGAQRDLAEEVAQAAWVRGWERRAQLRHLPALCFWVNSIARNILRNSFRRQQSMTELAETTLVDHPLESEPIDAGRLFDECTADERKLLEMYYLEGFTSQELSGELGLSAVGVRVRLTRLKKDLITRVHPGAGPQPQYFSAQAA
jgi:RNA polymerase sigma factor (sigma-70 family)